MAVLNMRDWAACSSPFGESSGTFTSRYGESSPRNSTNVWFTCVLHAISENCFRGVLISIYVVRAVYFQGFDFRHSNFIFGGCFFGCSNFRLCAWEDSRISVLWGLDRSIAHSIARSIAHSSAHSIACPIARLIARSIARSLARSIASSMARPLDRSLDRLPC